MDYHLILEFLGIIVIPFVIWLFNIQRDHDKQLQELKEGMTTKAKDGFQTVFKRMDDIKEIADKTFVRMDNYNIAKEYQEKDIDSKFKSMITVMNGQFENVESKIDSLKELINNKFKEKQKGE